MLKIVNFSKQYGSKIAVSNLNLLVQKGDIMGFIGKNGAGKTTTLKACMGIIRPTTGDIYVNDVSILANPIDCKREMAFVPDTPMLEEYMTGIQYLNFICDIYRVPVKTRKAKVDSLIEQFQMEKSINSLISSFSHGMKQKTALIAAFAHDPKILILDEPFIGLDPESFIILKNQMNRLRSMGGAILFSSHILDVVERVCNKIAVIKDGKLVYKGATEYVYPTMIEYVKTGTPLRVNIVNNYEKENRDLCFSLAENVKIEPFDKRMFRLKNGSDRSVVIDEEVRELIGNGEPKAFEDLIRNDYMNYFDKLKLLQYLQQHDVIRFI